jgi:hypothetical protein
MADTGEEVVPPPIPLKRSKSRTSETLSQSTSSDTYESPCDRHVTSETNENSHHEYSHLKHKGMSEGVADESESTGDTSPHTYSKLSTPAADLPSPAEESSERDLPSDWICGRGNPPTVPHKTPQKLQGDSSAFRLKLAPTSGNQRTAHGYEQFMTPTSSGGDAKPRATHSYEQFAPPTSSSGEGMKRAPSLEWDSADLPPPLPPKPSELVSDDHTHSSNPPTSIQEKWERQRRLNLAARQYDTIEIPAVQRKWIAEHDRHRQVRSYEDVDTVDWNFRPQLSLSESEPAPSSATELEKTLPLPLRRELDDITPSLPEGWEVDIQDGQIVYWHVATGKVQLVRPTGTESASTTYSVDDSKDDLKSLQEMVAKRQGHRSLGSYLGWVDIPAHEVVSGNLVSAAQRAITHVIKGRRVSVGLEGEEEIEGGQGVCLEIKGGLLHLFNLKTMALIRKQPLSDIKVFAIGRDNDRNLGYISHHTDVNSCKCHVFRLKSPAQNFVGSVLSQVKNDHALPTQGWEETVKETLHEDRLRHLSSHSNASGSSNSLRDRTPSTDGLDKGLDDEDADLVSNPTSDTLVDQEFNTYDYKRFECMYMGNMQVQEAFGQQMVFEALSKLSTDRSQWMDIFCDISPQCVRLVDKDVRSVLLFMLAMKVPRLICCVDVDLVLMFKLLLILGSDVDLRDACSPTHPTPPPQASGLSFAEHRVRFISFLGFGASDKMCGFVVDCGDSDYQCYGLYAEPNCDQLCLQLHLACQERFERVLQAHPEARNVADSLKKDNKPQSWISRLWSRRSYHPEGSSGGVSSKEAEGQKFVVHYLGCQVIPTSNDPDITLATIEILASSGPSHSTTVQLEVTPTGLSLYDPSKLLFKRKNYYAKDISYLLGKDKYFAFVYNETTGNRTTHRCHVIKTGEFEVDVKAIVQTIKSTLS